MYFRRDVERKLVEWKNDNHKKVLLVEGARQVGKTTTVMHFAKENYENVYCINMTFERCRRIETLLVEERTVKDAFKKYFADDGIVFVEGGDSVLFIDEVQESKVVWESIRQFRKELSVGIIISGSYLRRADGYFFPAGDLEYVTVKPLSFSEFIGIYGAREFYDRISTDCSVSDRFEWFDNAFSVYRLVGGYPIVIRDYLDGKNYDDCFADCIRVLAEDLKNNVEMLFIDFVRECMSSVIKVCVNNKRGDSRLIEHVNNALKSSVKNDLSHSKSEIVNLIAWIKSCGILQYCCKYDFATNTYNSNSNKPYLNDVGLLNYLMKHYGYEQSDIDGFVAETYVFNRIMDLAEERVLVGDTPAFGVWNEYEYDFFVKSISSKERYTIEVKSGNNSNKNLQKLIDNCKTDYVINFKGKTKGGIDGKKQTLPIWMVDRFVSVVKESQVEEKLPVLSVF